MRSEKTTSSQSHLIVCHTLYPSRLRPVVLAPAKYMSVGNQSDTCISSCVVVRFFSNRGLLTNPTPRMPPSHNDPFHPLRGQLFPPSNTWPPLSVNQAKMRVIMCRKLPTAIYKIGNGLVDVSVEYMQPNALLYNYTTDLTQYVIIGVNITAFWQEIPLFPVLDEMSHFLYYSKFTVKSEYRICNTQGQSRHP